MYSLSLIYMCVHVNRCVKRTRYPEGKFSYLRGLFSTALQHCNQRPHLSKLGMHFLPNAKVRFCR
jgi:hypothetical protein